MALVQVMGTWTWLEIACWYEEGTWPGVCCHGIREDAGTCKCGRFSRVMTEQQ
jgi:hypothetical protein